MKNRLSLLACVFLLSGHHAPLVAMKIDRVIMASDTNPTYLDFWPMVSRAWSTIVGVRPTLALISDKDIQIDQTYGEVIRIKPIEGISTAFQSQVIRLLLPFYFQNEVCLISDIDMIPLQKNYFLDAVATIANNCLVIYREPDNEWEQRFYMCYVAAQGKTFSSIFGIKKEADIFTIMRLWHAQNLGWDTDEKMLYRLIKQWKEAPTKCKRLHLPIEKRIDRSDWHYDISLLQQQWYIDSHMIRPYSAHKAELDNFFSLIGI